MSAIIDFFASIIDNVVAIFNLIVSVVRSAIWLIFNLPRMQGVLQQSIAYVPDFISVFMLVCLALILVFAIIKLL